MRNLIIAEATTQDQDWDWVLLQKFLLEDIVRKIGTVHPSMHELGEDKIIWKLTNCGEYLVASAYYKLANINEPQNAVWAIIWGWKGPQKIKYFMWMVVHKKLMTAQRKARIFGASPYCHKCYRTEETQIHILRDFPSASRV
ncbi:hypothetical protein AHAS_Ahas12G0173900 [Arachis hypogaea]